MGVLVNSQFMESRIVHTALHDREQEVADGLLLVREVDTAIELASESACEEKTGRVAYPDSSLDISSGLCHPMEGLLSEPPSWRHVQEWREESFKMRSNQTVP